MKINLKNIYLLVGLLTFSSCATIHTHLAPGRDILQYKRAYFEFLPKDEFNVGSLIVLYVNELGFQVINSPAPKDPLDSDMILKYMYEDGWDFVKYLKGLQVHFTDARTGQIVGLISYQKNGFGYTDSRVRDAFNEFRLTLGLPESKL
jgi:hypothetical protein